MLLRNVRKCVCSNVPVFVDIANASEIQCFMQLLFWPQDKQVEYWTLIQSSMLGSDTTTTFTQILNACCLNFGPRYLGTNIATIFTQHCLTIV